MEILIIVIHVLTCLLLVGVVLLQSGKGGGLGAGFGGASAAATQIFGGGGTGTFLSRATVSLAALFMITSMYLAYFSSSPRSALDLSGEAAQHKSQEDEVVEVGSGPPIDVDAPATEDQNDEGSASGTPQTNAGGTTNGAMQKLQLNMPKTLGSTNGGLKLQPGSGMLDDGSAPTEQDEKPASPEETAKEPAAAEATAKQPADTTPKPAAKKPAPAKKPTPAKEPAAKKPAPAKEPAAEKPADVKKPAPKKDAPTKDAKPAPKKSEGKPATNG